MMRIPPAALVRTSPAKACALVLQCRRVAWNSDATKFPQSTSGTTTTSSATQFSSPTVEYLRHRDKLPRSPHDGSGDRGLPRRAQNNPAPTQLNETINAKELLQQALASRSITSFQENCEALLALERRKLYAVHRPTTTLSPSNYVQLFHCARLFLRSSPHASLHHPVVVQLLDVFLELWAKPHAPTQLSDDVASNEWQCDHDATMHKAVAAALMALPPRDALHVMSECCLDNALVELCNEENHQQSSARGPLGVRGSVEHTAAVMQWCLQHVDTKAQKALLNRAVKRNAAASLPVSAAVFLQRVRTAQSPLVVAAVISSMISLGSRSSKSFALDLCDAYVNAHVKVPQVERDALYGVIRSATEAAAIVGDSELVARLIFVLFRVKGALCAPPHVVSTSASSVMDALRQWWQSSPMSSSGLSENATDTGFDETVAVLLKDTIHAAIKERGVDHAEALFEALRTGCTWRAVSSMSLELLDALARLNVTSAENTDETLQRRAMDILGRMAVVYPRQPSSSDEKRMTLAVRRTMQLHFEYIPVWIPLLHTPAATASNVPPPSSTTLYWPRPKNPIRSLELYERLPYRNAMRRDVRYLALSSASFLQSSDGGAQRDKLLKDEEDEESSNDELMHRTSSILLAATWALGCLCWDRGMDVTQWTNVIGLQPTPAGHPTAKWLITTLSAASSRLAVFHVVCGVLQRCGCPTLRHPLQFLEWSDAQLRAVTSSTLRCSTADAILNALVQQPLWKLEGQETSVVEEHRRRLVARCCEALLNGGANDGSVLGCSAVRCIAPPHDVTVPVALQGIAAGSMAAVLHPSIAALSAAQVLEFVASMRQGKQRPCYVFVPWEVMSPRKTLNAAGLCANLAASLRGHDVIIVPVVVSLGPQPPSNASETVQPLVESVLSVVLQHLPATVMEVTVWAESAAVASSELRSVLSNPSNKRIEVIGVTDLHRKQSLLGIQEVFSRDSPSSFKHNFGKLRQSANNVGAAADTASETNVYGAIRAKAGSAGGLRRGAAVSPQHQKER